MVDQVAGPVLIEAPDKPDKMGSLNIDREQTESPAGLAAFVVAGKQMGGLLGYAQVFITPGLGQPPGHELLEAVDRVHALDPPDEHLRKGKGGRVKA